MHLRIRYQTTRKLDFCKTSYAKSSFLLPLRVPTSIKNHLISMLKEIAKTICKKIAMYVEKPLQKAPQSLQNRRSRSVQIDLGQEQRLLDDPGSPNDPEMLKNEPKESPK